MSDVAAFQIVFAASVVVAAGLLAAAFLGWASRVPLIVAGVLGGAATAAWIAFALDPDADLAVAAAGTTGCAVAALAAYALGKAVARSRAFEEKAEQAQARLEEAVVRTAEDHAAEVERTLARARADSVSLLTQQERQLAEERRATAADQRRDLQSELAASLSAAQARFDQRLAAWSDDLERAQQALSLQATRLAQRQEQVLKDAEARIDAESRRLDDEGRTQRETILRVREDVERVAQEAIDATRTDLDAHAVERRRALDELEDRLKRRERDLYEQVERQESEAAARLQAGFADVERRQLEQLTRVVDRASVRYAEAANKQFEDSAKRARDSAGQRLARELERAVATYVREAQSIFSERLGHVGDTGAQRLERRFDEVAAGLERQREEMLKGLEGRLGDVEADLRRRLESVAADTEAERGILEARLHGIARRIDELAARAEERLGALQSTRR